MSFPAFDEVGSDPLFVRQPSATVVYVHLKGRLNFTEFRIQKTMSIARRTGLEPRTVGAALKALCDNGFLLWQPFDGRTRSYQLVFSREKRSE